MRSLGVGDDQRLNLIKESHVLDARINFICLDYPNFIDHMDQFDADSEE